MKWKPKAKPKLFEIFKRIDRSIRCRFYPQFEYKICAIFYPLNRSSHKVLPNSLICRHNSCFLQYRGPCKHIQRFDPLDYQFSNTHFLGQSHYQSIFLLTGDILCIQINSRKWYISFPNTAHIFTRHYYKKSLLNILH